MNSNGCPVKFLRELLGIRNRRRRADELRLASIKCANSSQPPKHIRHMAAENAAIGMQFIHDDKLQIFKQPRPPCVMRQDALVQHVGIAENDVAARTNGRPRILRRVAVI